MSTENKRAGREKELRQKVRDATDRFESVFGRPLSVGVLREFLDESRKHNRLVFLKDRVGILSDADVDFLENVLKENSKQPESKLQTLVDDQPEDVEFDGSENADDLDEADLSSLT